MKLETMVSRLCTQAKGITDATLLARFLHAILSDGLKWWQDEALFTQETHTKANGKLTVLPGSTRRKYTAASLAEHEVVPWSDWKRLMRKWHWKLALVSLSSASIHTSLTLF